MFDKNDRKHRRWFVDARLWGILCLFIALAIWLASCSGDVTPSPEMVAPPATKIIQQTITSTVTATPTIIASPEVAVTPTGIPLVWNQISTGSEFSRDTITGMAFDPQNSDVIYLGSQNSGIYKSADGGLSWENSETGPIISYSKITYLPSWTSPYNNNVVFRVRRVEHVEYPLPILEKSSDAGKTWKKSWDLFTDSSNLMAFDSTNDLVMYLSEGDQLFKTYNGGETWGAIYNFPTDFISAIFPVPGDSESVFVGTQGVFYSKNGGKNWEKLSSGIGMGRVELMASLDGSTLFAVEKMDPSDAYPLQQRLLRSLDGGYTWDLLIDQPGIGFSLGANKTVYYSIHSTDVYKSDNDGKTWFMYNKPLFNNDNERRGAIIVPNPQAPDVIYSIHPYYGPPMRVSFDSGKSWQEVENPFPQQRWQIVGLYFDYARGQIVYAASFDRIARSNDGGRSWYACSTVDTFLGTFGMISANSTSSVAIDAQDGNIIYVSTDKGSLLISHDGCATWMVSKVPGANVKVRSLAVDPNKLGVVYAGTTKGVFVSYDKGEHWGEISDGLLGTTIVYSIAVDSQSNVYAATPNGVFQLIPK